MAYGLISQNLNALNDIRLKGDSMKSKLLISLGLLLTPAYSYAINSDDVLHGTAHFGATYVITHTTDVACKRIRGKGHGFSCAVIGVVAANVANVAYKASQAFPNDTNRAIISGAAGSAFAVTVIAIDF